MRAKLIFNLPKERDEFTLACDGIKWFSIVHTFMGDSLRPRIKYDEAISDESRKLLKTLRAELVNLMDANGVSLDDVL